MTDFLALVDQLAAKIAQEAIDQENLETRIDAFKAIAPYYTLLFKQKGKSDDEPDGPTFGDLGAGFNGGTGKEIRDRRGIRHPEPGDD